MQRLREILIQWNEVKNWIMIAAAILIVITAVFFFGKENSQTITLEEAGSPESTVLSDDDESVEESGSSENASPMIYVDIDGKVKNPGVYQVAENSRIFQVIELAGGLTKDADTSSINQAEAVYDGAKIHIPGKDEEMASASLTESGSVDGSDTGQTAYGKININTAGPGELEKLPGIGQVTAARIIDYRTANGSFHSIEDIKNVSGIGDKTFEKMKDQITV